MRDFPHSVNEPLMQIEILRIFAFSAIIPSVLLFAVKINQKIPKFCNFQSLADDLYDGHQFPGLRRSDLEEKSGFDFRVRSSAEKLVSTPLNVFSAAPTRRQE